MKNELKKISEKNFALIQKQMQENGMDGIPYRDAKTYKKWQEEGFQVKKGEKSKLHAVMIIEKETKKGIKKFAKKYFLFHKSQVEKIDK